MYPASMPTPAAPIAAPCQPSIACKPSARKQKYPLLPILAGLSAAVLALGACGPLTAPSASLTSSQHTVSHSAPSPTAAHTPTTGTVLVFKKATAHEFGFFVCPKGNLNLIAHTQCHSAYLTAQGLPPRFSPHTLTTTTFASQDLSTIAMASPADQAPSFWQNKQNEVLAFVGSALIFVGAVISSKIGLISGYLILGYAHEQLSKPPEIASLQPPLRRDHSSHDFRSSYRPFLPSSSTPPPKVGPFYVITQGPTGSSQETGALRQRSFTELVKSVGLLLKSHPETLKITSSTSGTIARYCPTMAPRGQWRRACPLLTAQTSSMFRLQ